MALALDAQIEAILFRKAAPMRTAELARICGTPEQEVEKALRVLKENLSGRGVILVQHRDEAEIRTAAEASALLEKIAREELSRELGKAGSEALAIVLYRNGATRREIDWVRGVNSSFTLRELAARGLVTRIGREGSGYRYEATPELFAHLGVSRVEELPEYEQGRKELVAVKI